MKKTEKIEAIEKKIAEAAAGRADWPTEIVEPVADFIRGHRDDAKIIALAETRLQALCDYCFSHCERLAYAIRESKACENAAFRKAVGL